MKDALGKELVMSDLYGYSNTSNGITTIKAGYLVSINRERVTLDIIYAAKALYSDDVIIETEWTRHIAVKSNMIFPIISI